MSMNRLIGTLAACTFLAVPVTGFAEGVANGANEFAGRLSYVNVDAKDVETTETTIQLAYGRYFTEMHEAGAFVSYFRQDLDVQGFGSETLDGSTFYDNQVRRVRMETEDARRPAKRKDADA